jgi:hypothetical protein
MVSALTELFRVVIGPGVIAAIVTFFLTTRDERRRTFRDHVTKIFDETRDDIRDAVEAGVAYFSCNKPEELRALEAQVLLYESDIRSSLSVIRSMCRPEEISFIAALERAEGDFLAVLTGGSFGAEMPSPDRNRAREIIGFGTRVRSELARLRRYQLAQTRAGSGNRAGGLFLIVIMTVMIAHMAGLYLGLLLRN